MNHTEMALSHTCEEAAELVKACIKAQRFGLDYFWDKEGKTNREAIQEEAHDVMGMIYILNQMEIISIDLGDWKPNPDKTAKRDRMLHLSADLGLLHP